MWHYQHRWPQLTRQLPLWCRHTSVLRTPPHLSTQTHTIITGDIGGTNARLGLWKCSPGGKNEEVYSETYSTSTFPTFEECLQAFLDESEVGGWSFGGRGGVCDLVEEVVGMAEREEGPHQVLPTRGAPNSCG